MSGEAPIRFVWTDDGTFRPAGQFWSKRADKLFAIGETYDLVEHHERSTNSHNHFFAALTEAWRNLPEGMADRYPTVEHLRKYALIKAGYCDTQTAIFATRKDAEKAAALISPLDEFSIVDVRDTTLTRYVARSQSRKAMGKEDFQRSKEVVLEIAADMVGVTAPHLATAAREAA